MRETINQVMPRPLLRIMRFVYEPIRDLRFKYIGRPKVKAESSKAYARRVREGFFDKYCQGRGLDIGYGGDILAKNCRGWDFEDGDAQYLKGIKNESFDFVYSSHTIEHMVVPEISLQNWWRVLKPGGYLIVYLPHRDLYEKRKTLPSRWNSDHKHFFLPETDEPPDTRGVAQLIERSLHRYELIYLKECSEGHTITDPEIHSDGEYSIEVVVRKLENE
ncbi:MAG: class I SAM-dependent methyltransferase [Acidobacteriota bacterium]